MSTPAASGTRSLAGLQNQSRRHYVRCGDEEDQLHLKSDLIHGTLTGLIILGIGSRLLMRVVALMQETPPGWSFGGTMTVVFLGTVSGLGAGIIYHLLRRFVKGPWVRTAAFIGICGLIAWRGVHGVAPLHQAMFMSLALAYLGVVDVLGRRPLKQGALVHTDLALPVRG